MLVQDFVTELDYVYFAIKDEKYLTFTEEGVEKYSGLRSFVDKAFLEHYYFIYEYTEDTASIDNDRCFTTKYVLVPSRCIWSSELAIYIQNKDCRMVPEEYYEFIDFCGVHFPHCFILDKLKEEKLWKK